MKDGLIVGAAKQNKVNSTSKAGLAILSFRAQFVSLAYRLKGFWVILLQGNFLPKILSTQTMNTIFTLKKFQLSDANSRMNKPLFKTFLSVYLRNTYSRKTQIDANQSYDVIWRICINLGFSAVVFFSVIFDDHFKKLTFNPFWDKKCWLFF